MAKQAKDRRVERTRKFLRDALIELSSEKGYESVTVQQILDRANIGRSTFYAHFRDKDELLESCFEALDELFERHNLEMTHAGARGDTDLPLGLFRFAAENHLFFKALLGKRGSGVFNRHVYDYLFSQLRKPIKHLMQSGEYGPFQAEVTAHYYVSAVVGTLVWWVEKDMPCPPEEIAELLKQLTMRGFHGIRRESASVD